METRPLLTAGRGPLGHPGDGSAAGAAVRVTLDRRVLGKTPDTRSPSTGTWLCELSRPGQSVEPASWVPGRRTLYPTQKWRPPAVRPTRELRRLEGQAWSPHLQGPGQLIAP